MIETEDIRLSQERLTALKELITPIKDLAKNWNVDINSELEKYMSTFELDVNHTDNFAEAALVIQGSAGVWSKKVEFLYSLAVDSLGMLEEKEKKVRGKGGGDDDNDDSDGEEMMTLMPVVIKRATQVNVDLCSLARSEHFKRRVPLFLSAISVKNDKPENLLYNKKGELLASRDDFAINNCIINKSGFASLDIQTCLLLNQSNKKTNILTPFFKRHVSQFDGFVNQGNSNPQSINPAAAVDEVMDIQPGDDNPVDEGPHDILEDDELDPGGALDLCDDETDHEVSGFPEINAVNHSKLNLNEPKTPQPSHSMQLRNRLSISQVTAPQEKTVESKITKTLDPYMELPVKPFKKAIIEKPKVSRKRKKENAPKTSLMGLLQSSDKAMSKNARFPNLLRKPGFPENTELFKNLKTKELKSNRWVGKKLAAASQNQLLPVDLLKPPIPAESPDLDSDDPGPEPDDDFCGTISENPNMEENPLVDLETSHLETLEASQREALKPQIVQPSYEDMVKEHVMKYTSEARNHFHVSELRGRVLEWENKITPILDEEAKNSEFNVCDYSNKLLDKLALCPKETTQFKNLVSGEKKGEVSRLFLTSLMLSNSGNIQLKGDDDGAECKLLSRKLFSDVLEGYVASASEEIPATSSKRKRKNAPS